MIPNPILSLAVKSEIKELLFSEAIPPKLVNQLLNDFQRRRNM